jgi:ADP-dependent NAD(P)H-hydrate dehydratase / NAD(P)H-hydrate epimerase
MLSVLRVAQVRQAEEAAMADLADGALMQRAAMGLATICVDLLDRVYGARIVLLVGGGNNGGDALWAGAMLARRGAQVHALLATDHAHPEGLAALREAGGRVTTNPAVAQQADVVIDGLLGIGGRGALRDQVKALAAIDTPGIVVAVDVPSGVDADTGVVAAGAVVADVTVTFGCLKPGLLVLPGLGHVGELVTVNIGLDFSDVEAAAHCLTADDVAQLLPALPTDTYKYERGVVGIAAGSPQFPGAAVLSVGAALRAGAGMVAFLDRMDGVADQVRAHYPDVVTNHSRARAWLIGPGFVGDAADVPTIEFALASESAVVLDAGALRALADSEHLRDAVRHRTAVTVLTPHDGEFAAIAAALDLDITEVDRFTATHRVADALGCIVVRKGPGTIIAPGYIDRMGGPELAVAGSGDVLSGMIASMLAQSPDADPVALTAAAVFVHGLAGASTGSNPCTASDLITWLPDTIGELRELA